MVLHRIFLMTLRSNVFAFCIAIYCRQISLYNVICVLIISQFLWYRWKLVDGGSFSSVKFQEKLSIEEGNGSNTHILNPRQK